MLRTSVAALCLVALWTAGASANDKDPARFAPQNAIAYVGIDDLTQFLDSSEKLAWFRMMKENEDFTTRELTFISKLFEEARKGFAKAIQTEPDKLKNPFGGNVAVFLEIDDKDQDAPGFVAVMGVKDKATLQGYYGKLIERFKGAADTYDREDFSGAGIDIFTATPKASEVDPEELGFDPNSNPFDLSDEAMTELIDSTFGQWFSGETLPENLAMCLTDEYLYLGQTGDQIKGVIRRGRGADSLTGHEDYKFLLKRFKEHGSMRMLVNIPRLLEVAPEGPDPKMQKALGVEGFGSMIGHYRFGKPGEYESRWELLWRMRGQRSGIPRLLSLDNVDLAPGKTVGADAAIFVNLQVSAGKLFDEILRIVRQVDPTTADEMVAGLGEVETPDGTMNIRKDVIDNITGPLQFQVITGRPYTPETMRMMATIGHRDQGAMNRLLEMARNSLPVPLTDRDFEGETLYEMPIGGMALCASRDTLVVGSGAAVQARLRGAASNPLEASPGWRKATEYLPEKAWFTVYVDARQMFDAGLALAEKRDDVMGMAMVNPAAAAVLGMAESMTFIPEEDQLSRAKGLGRYMGIGAMTFSTTPDGLLWTQIQLHPQAN